MAATNPIPRNYAQKDADALDVKEPAVAYYTDRVGNAVAGPYGTDTGGDWLESGGECPVCAKHRDPITGEPRYNAETAAAIEEGRAMLRGEIPAKWYNSLDEMLADLDADD